MQCLNTEWTRKDQWVGCLPDSPDEIYINIYELFLSFLEAFWYMKLVRMKGEWCVGEKSLSFQWRQDSTLLFKMRYLYTFNLYKLFKCCMFMEVYFVKVPFMTCSHTDLDLTPCLCLKWAECPCDGRNVFFTLLLFSFRFTVMWDGNRCQTFVFV